MDIRSITAPTITDRNALEEFFEALIYQAPNVERDVSRLKKTPGDRESRGWLVAVDRLSTNISVRDWRNRGSCRECWQPINAQ